MDITTMKPEVNTGEIAAQEPFKYYVQCASIPEIGQPTSGIMRRIMIIQPPANPE